MSEGRRITWLGLLPPTISDPRDITKGSFCGLPCCLEAAARPPVASTPGLGVLPDTLSDITNGFLPEWHALLQISFYNGWMDFSHSLNHDDGLQTQNTGAVIQFSICLNCVFAKISRARKGEDNMDSVTQWFEQNCL